MSPTELGLMKAVLLGGAEGTHREALIRQAGISKASFYRSIQPLLDKGVLREQGGGHYLLPLDHPYNYAFKLWHDQERLLQIEEPLRSEIFTLVETIRQELGSNLLALWLVGSTAHATSHEGSDLDLVAVVRKLQDCSPRGSRPIQLPMFTEKNFRELYSRGDSFVRTALQYGLVLLDRGFAQEFYATPMPQPAIKAFREREETLEELRHRLTFFLQQNAADEARQALSSVAVATGRLMLERLGELPAGKQDLLRWVELYFGPRFSGLIKKCLNKTADRSDMARLNWELDGWYLRFKPHASYLEGLAQSLSGPSGEFSAAVATMLRSLFPKETPPVAALTLKGGVTSDLPKFQRLGVSVVVLNPLREVPPTRRPEIAPDLHREAERLDITLLDSRSLFQFHNRVLLEDDPPPAQEWLEPRPVYVSGS